MRRIFTITWILLVVLVSLNLASAQGVVTLTYGTSTPGTLSDASPATLFVFNGNAGEFVAVQVTGITPGMTVSLSLLGSAQQALGNDDSDPFGLSGRSARVTARLPQAGVYSVLVSGTPGEFLISIDSRTSSAPPLQANTPTQVTSAVGAGTQYLSFNGDPAAQTSLQIASVNGTDFIAEIYDNNGGLVTAFNGGVLNACLTLPPGDNLYEMSIASANRSVEGLFSVAHLSGGCASSSASAQPAGVPTVATAAPALPTPVPQGNANPNQPPVQIAGVCTASSTTNTNIRSGPGTNFNVAGMLVAGLGIQVTGQTSNGWYAVLGSDMQGYVAMSVVRVVGPCDGLPIVSASGGAAQPTPDGQSTPTGNGQPTAPLATEEAAAEATPAVS